MPLFYRFAIVLAALALAVFGIAVSGAAQGQPTAPLQIVTLR